MMVILVGLKWYFLKGLLKWVFKGTYELTTTTEYAEFRSQSQWLHLQKLLTLILIEPYRRGFKVQ